MILRVLDDVGYDIHILEIFSRYSPPSNSQIFTYCSRLLSLRYSMSNACRTTFTACLSSSPSSTLRFRVDRTYIDIDSDRVRVGFYQYEGCTCGMFVPLRQKHGAQKVLPGKVKCRLSLCPRPLPRSPLRMKLRWHLWRGGWTRPDQDICIGLGRTYIRTRGWVRISECTTQQNIHQYKIMRF